MHNLKSRLTSIMRNYIADKPEPGAAIGLIKNGELIFAQGYGYANIEHEIPITPDTPFYLASVSKALTAAAILLLCQRREMDLATPVATYLADWPHEYKEITVQHLMHHTSGLPDYLRYFSQQGIPYFWQTNDDVWKYLLQRPDVDFPVGTKFQYSNTGYALLAILVGVVSGQPFEQFLRENIFGPLGMNSTTAYYERGLLIPKKVYSYGFNEEAQSFVSNDYTMLTMGDGGIYSTINDLYRWDQALHSEQILNKESLKLMFTPGTLSDGTPHNYAGGWRIHLHEGKRVAQHSGSLFGFRNYFTRHLDKRMSCIILTNCPRPEMAQLPERLGEVLQELNGAT